MNDYIVIQREGFYTTIQDNKRIGYKRYGIPESGPMDENSYMFSNWLVGNNLNSEVLEITYNGPKIKFTFNAKIAICGSLTNIYLNKIKIKMNQTIKIKQNDILDISSCKNGNRVYLAIAGKINIKTHFNSKSTYDKCSIGGYKGRKLLKNDKIKIIANEIDEVKKLPEILSSKFTENNLIRIIPGPEYNLLDQESKNKLTNGFFEIDIKSDRMGIRLCNNRIKLLNKINMESSLITKGSIQLPPDGNPIIIMSDGQTTGGYPRIGVVSKVDISRLSQIKIRNNIKFKIISLRESENLIKYNKNKFITNLGTIY